MEQIKTAIEKAGGLAAEGTRDAVIAQNVMAAVCSMARFLLEHDFGQVTIRRTKERLEVSTQTTVRFDLGTMQEDN